MTFVVGAPLRLNLNKQLLVITILRVPYVVPRHLVCVVLLHLPPPLLPCLCRDSRSVCAPPLQLDPELVAKAAEWTEHTAPDGRKYYYNAKLQQSVWVKPQAITDLEGKRFLPALSLTISPTPTLIEHKVEMFCVSYFLRLFAELMNLSHGRIYLRVLYVLSTPLDLPSLKVIFVKYNDVP